MAFVNEFVPPLEEETSDFLRSARGELRTGYSKRNIWTVDREKDMALCRDGGGSSMETQNHEYWFFVDRKGRYSFITKRLNKTEISSDEIALTRSIGFQTGPHSVYPDAETKACVKAALREYKDYGAISDYKTCLLTLIDAITGEEI